MAVWLTACSTRATETPWKSEPPPSDTPSLTATLESTATLAIQTPTPRKPSSTPTKSLTPTATNTPGITPTPIRFDVTLLRESPTEGAYQQIVTAFWSPDGTQIFYATDDGFWNNEPKFPRWFSIDVKDGKEKALVRPPDLTYQPDFDMPGAGMYYLYEGYVSPSGKYQLEIRDTTVWLLDKTGRQPKTAVLDFGTPSFYRKAYWFEGETKVLFGLRPGYGTYLYLLDVATQKVTPFYDITGFEDVNLLNYWLSPTGKQFAVIDGNRDLQIISLDRQPPVTFSGYFMDIVWSRDGQRLYFSSGSGAAMIEKLEAYDLETGKRSTILDWLQLEKQGIPSSYFDVSPTGDRLIIWNGSDIYLVRLD